MRAVERTSKLFLETLKDALPDVHFIVSWSKTRAGRSCYVYIYAPHRVFKVRISDHAVGMRRALSGSEDLYISAGASPAFWAVWVGKIVSIVKAKAVAS